MARTILIFIAKPRHMSFGGNDTFAIQLAKNWPAEDTVVFAFNATNPCRDIFIQRLQARAQIELLNEPMTAEKRMAIAARTPESPLYRALLEFGLDVVRPFQSLASIIRLSRLLGKYQLNAIILNIGGNPPEDLGWRMMLAAWIRRVPRIIMVNQSYPGQGTNPLRRAVLFVLRRLTRFFCDILVAPSEDMARVFAESMRDKRPPVVIPYGIDPLPENGLPLDAKRRALGITSGSIIGAVGNLEERKGLHVLVQAMPVVLKQVPDAKLIIIGYPADPIYAENFKKLIKTLNLESRIKYMGYLQDAGQYFECFDVCVVPSISGEGFGIVAIEALRYKKPVVATTNGGLKEVLVNGETGYLVPEGDAGALADALVKLLRSPELREKMGQNSYQRFSSLYTTQTMIDRYVRLAYANPPPRPPSSAIPDLPEDSLPHSASPLQVDNVLKHGPDDRS